MAEVFVGAGSNVDRERNIGAGVAMLRERFGEVRVSSSWNTKAVGFDGDDFLNLAAAFETALDAHALVDVLHGIETACGRRRGTGQGVHARTLDLDLLLYGDAIIDDGTVQVPRDEILRHAYVLAPLAELAPGVRHPVDGRTLGELWRDFDGDRSGLAVVTSRSSARRRPRSPGR